MNGVFGIDMYRDILSQFFGPTSANHFWKLIANRDI